MAINEAATLSRRTFVKGSLAGLALAGAAGSALYGCAPKSEEGAKDGGAAGATDEIVWSQCNVNCGGRCVFQWHVKDGKIAYMETDNTGEAEGLQARACRPSASPVLSVSM